MMVVVRSINIDVNFIILTHRENVKTKINH